MARTVQHRRETATDSFWREKVEECPQCWRPFAALLGLALIALTFL